MTGELLDILVKARKDRYETEEGKEWAEAVLTFDEPKEKLLFKFKLKKETETVIHEIKIKEEVESGAISFVNMCVFKNLSKAIIKHMCNIIY